MGCQVLLHSPVDQLAYVLEALQFLQRRTLRAKSDQFIPVYACTSVACSVCAMCSVSCVVRMTNGVVCSALYVYVCCVQFRRSCVKQRVSIHGSSRPPHIRLYGRTKSFLYLYLCYLSVLRRRHELIATQANTDTDNGKPRTAHTTTPSPVTSLLHSCRTLREGRGIGIHNACPLPPACSPAFRPKCAPAVHPRRRTSCTRGLSASRRDGT